ncbi:hypothetical protein M427DRAFT_197858 [Gonapodya prolifera JEL478]|uniref:Uncharacterized protein n=1 Tax=Gonapodya prolifera (strain JEL478) TaxID=1344416 RepID=A0A139APP0_GONPJ|nr:hypothetical protein M427DRAFT_197858 [Gonapodya prolifera JEL478]|eukprot:KXS18706.1 hypothetical protein M427DRAFT_197858 [Gonapodya prolifera JEL478]
MRAEITALREENARLAFDNARLRECCASTNITDPHAPIGPEDSTNTFQDDLDSEIAGEEDPFRVPRRKRKRTEVHDSDTDGGVEAYHDETEDSIEHDADDEVAENLRDETAEDEESDDQPCDPDDDSVAAATVLAGLHAERDAQQARLDTARSRASDVDRHLKSAMWFSRRAVLEFNQAMKEADAAAQRLCDLQDDLGDSAFVEEEFG